MKDFLKAIINEICLEEKIKCINLCNGYITALEKNGITKFINDTHIGSNSYISTLLADDKYAMYEVLKSANIPVVEYKMICDRDDVEIDGKIEEIKRYYTENNNHIVLKPNRGYSGKLVFNIENKNQIEPVFRELIKEETTIVANPFYDAKNEHRVVLLNGVARLVYTKTLADGGWQFNLSKGAKSSKVESKELKERLEELAKRAYDYIGANFVSVDIFESQEGKLDILEINGGVSMTKYVEQHPEEYEKVKQIYKDAILGMFEN